jgi:putative ABC transport system permease protein
VAVPIKYSLRSVVVRWKSSLLAITGIGLVVAVFVGLLSMASGFRLALRASGNPENAIVLEKGAMSELGSSFSQAAGNWLGNDPRIARSSEGTPFISPELVAIVALPKRSDGEVTNVGVRGVTPLAFRVRNEVSIVAGRHPERGSFEVVVGRQAQSRIRALDLGSRISLMKHDFEVVGVLSADGSVFDSEIWGDFDTMASAFNRAGTVNSLTVRLEHPSDLPSFDKDLQANLQYPLEMTGERQYYEDQAGPLSKFLQGLAAFVAVLMGIGAIFGAMNTMYAVVANRTREVGTLRMLGFPRSAILTTFVFEGVLLALVGDSERPEA